MIYLASPYSHRDPLVVKERYDETLRTTAALLRQGLHVYSPIVHCHELAKAHMLPTDAAFWKDYNFHMISLADELWVLQLPGWSDSVGVRQERDYALAYGKLVSYIDPPEHV